MVRNATRHFDDPGVVGVAGNLRVAQCKRSLVTRLQLEYLVSIAEKRAVEFNRPQHSGAFGVFRTAFIRNLRLGCGTAKT